MSKQASQSIARGAFLAPSAEPVVSSVTLGAPSEDYHQDYSRLSCTLLKVFKRSRLEYFHRAISGKMKDKPATEAMDLGSIIHAVLLEDKPLEEVAREYPADCYKSDGTLNGKRTAALRADNPGVVFVKQLGSIEAVVEAVLDSPLLPIVTEADGRERVIEWDELDVPCRAKPDFYCDTGDKVVCYDLKVTPQIAPDDFHRQSRRFLYWLQDAHYSAGLAAAFGKPVEFRFWLIEPAFPYRILPRWYHARAREIASDARRELVKAVAECARTGNWSDAWEPEMNLDVWDVGEAETEWEGDE